MDKYIAIEYPAIVKNVDRALETLGGMTAIEEVRTMYRTMILEIRKQPVAGVPIPTVEPSDQW